MTYGKLEKGSILLIAEGDYSDYGVTGIFRVIDTLDIDAEYEKFSPKNKTPYKDVGAKRLKFIPWLLRKNLIESMAYNALHFSSYPPYFSLEKNK